MIRNTTGTRAERADMLRETAREIRLLILDMIHTANSGHPGGSLSAALGARKEIPSYVARWIGAGERSGQTDRVFAQVRSYFQAEMDRGTSRFTALLEPALIVFVGGVVLFLVAAFVLPLFSLSGSML